ncbi:hypothetical protein CBR_g28584 [Chara braunii]|uniref:Uncharacterized protein n=1 Tax=Chara braunii TaxID=69332 RepID=A0A388L979_CHABU|nr:hypothetical protein CBR_g28584 [Chara braunii]|eukprot:GBG78869.1 hypothetical protein CBR_g28584 [Chara braunii]
MDLEFRGTVEARGWVYLSQDGEKAMIIELAPGNTPDELFRKAEAEVVWAACQRKEMEMEKVDVRVELGDRVSMRRPVRTMRCVLPSFLVDAVFGTLSRLVRICQSMTNLGLYQCARQDFFRLSVEMGPFEGNWAEELAEILNCLNIDNIFVPGAVHWGIVYRNVAIGETFLDGVRELVYDEEDDFRKGKMAREERMMEYPFKGWEPRRLRGGIEMPIPTGNGWTGTTCDWIGFEVARDLSYVWIERIWNPIREEEGWDDIGEDKVESVGTIFEDAWHLFCTMLAMGQDPMWLLGDAEARTRKEGKLFANEGWDEVSSRVVMGGWKELKPPSLRITDWVPEFIAEWFGGFEHIIECAWLTEEFYRLSLKYEPFYGDKVGEVIIVLRIGREIAKRIASPAIHELAIRTLSQYGITSAQWQAMLDAADENEKPFFQKLYDDAVQREREAEAAARTTSIADQVALLQVPEANADRFQERLAVAVAAFVPLRTLEDLESRVTALEQRNQELQAEILSLKQSQLSAPRPPNPQPAAVPVSQSNTVLMARASGTLTNTGTGASSSSGSTDSSALVIVPNARTSAQNATVLTGVQYSGPVVDKWAATLPSKYDGKGDITSWISSMRSYFEVLRTPQEDRSMIMGTNIESAVWSFIELQAVTAGYERIDLTEWLKVTPVRTLEDLLITRYQDKHAALKARLKLEALKGQAWRTSMQALEQHLTGLFTTPNLGMTDVSCMDVVMGVAPKEYLSLLALKDHTTWRELMMDLVDLDAKDLARRKKAPAAGSKSQRKRYGSSNQLALHEHREAEDQSYADDLFLDDDLEPDSDMG